MKTTLKAIIYLLLFYAFGVSCSDENIGSKMPKPLNPNGDSELALLMRAMYDEAEQIKQQINSGDSITLSLDHEKILTAHATEPDKAASPEYKAFAKTYLQAVKSLTTASPSQRINVYDNLVSNCISCHKALCPGPIIKIKKLQ